jgi:hypothetical protein
VKEIIISENCFGPDVLIDQESLFVHKYENRDLKKIDNIKKILIKELNELRNDLTINDWTKILEIIIDKPNKYEYDVDNSTEIKNCEQCGNWNHKYVFKKIK